MNSFYIHFRNAEVLQTNTGYFSVAEQTEFSPQQLVFSTDKEKYTDITTRRNTDERGKS